MTDISQNTESCQEQATSMGMSDAETPRVESTEEDETPSLPTLGEFLLTCPPGVRRSIDTLWENQRSLTGGIALNQTLCAPQITLHCDVCAGERAFLLRGPHPRKPEVDSAELFLTYVCRNCGKYEKRYALLVEKDGHGGAATKYGEVPPLGGVLPRRLEKVAGKGRDYLRKGYKAELAGMGIGAFAYYRRLLDSQRLQILDEIIAASELLQADAEVLADLAAAKKETRFTTSIEAVKHGLPQALLIDGHNPLTLLHDALSDGLHSESDEDCLQLATTTRVLLTEILERVAMIRSDKAEIKAAVANLLKRKAQKAAK